MAKTAIYVLEHPTATTLLTGRDGWRKHYLVFFTPNLEPTLAASRLVWFLFGTVCGPWGVAIWPLCFPLRLASATASLLTSDPGSSTRPDPRCSCGSDDDFQAW